MREERPSRERGHPALGRTYARAIYTPGVQVLDLDTAYMERACALAERGAGHVAPNPLVGAVIVKDGRIVGEGFHRRFGGLHAEREALASCTESPLGATMYVTLEPCCHQGKQPPCTDALLEAGITRVVCGVEDPNPLVRGKGMAALREAGIEVELGVGREACERVNEIFLHFMRTGMPFVLMKYAMTLDGKIACSGGASRWITGEDARRHVHATRGSYGAVMVGVGTLLADDPLLTCRIDDAHDPPRIVCDSHLRTPLDARLVATARETPTLIATCVTSESEQLPYLEAGCEMLVTGGRDGRVDLRQLMELLAARNISSVLLEGGSELNWAALEAGIVCKLHAYVAPKLFGGADAPGPLAGTGYPDPTHALVLERMQTRHFGDDLLVEGYVMSRCSPG